MKKSNLFRKAISIMMESVTLDKGGNLKILDESAMSEADELINQMIVETAREWWAQLESQEDSLSDMSDEVSFSELNADPSHISSSRNKKDANDETMESMLDGDEFDLKSIFEDELDGIGMDDGDEKFGDLQRDDEETMDDDGEASDDMGVIGDNDMDSDAGPDRVDPEANPDSDMGMVDPVDDEFDFSFLDDPELGSIGDDDGDFKVPTKPDLDGEVGFDDPEEDPDLDGEVSFDDPEEDPDLEEMATMGEDEMTDMDEMIDMDETQ